MNFDKIYEWTDPLPEKNKHVSYNDKHDSHYQANHGDEPHTHSINQNDEKNNHYDKSKKDILIKMIVMVKISGNIILQCYLKPVI